MDYTYNTLESHKEKFIERELLKKKRSFFKRKLSVKNYIKLLSLFLVFIFFVYLFLYSPVFSIQEIEVNRLDYIDSREIKKDFAHLIGGNFFLTDLTDVREDVIKNHVFISRIYTEKLFPSTILVNIVEKVPFIIVNTGSECYLLDKEGYVLSPNHLCSELKASYLVKEVLGTDVEGIEFEYGMKSSFYDIGKIHDVSKVLDYYGYSFRDMSLERQTLRINLSGSGYLVFSVSNDLDIQLKRFIILVKHFESNPESFELVDFRYERPLLRPSF